MLEQNQLAHRNDSLNPSIISSSFSGTLQVRSGKPNDHRRFGHLLSAIAISRDVLHHSGILKTQRSGHAASLAPLLSQFTFAAMRGITPEL